MNQTRRNRAQQIGDLGESCAQHIATKSKIWIARKVDKDFGVDMEMELLDDGKVTGQYVKVQIKGTEKYRIVDNEIKLRVKSKFLKYCEECRVPIILVLININSEIGHYIWVQEYLRTHKPIFSDKTSCVVRVAATNDFAGGLKGKIRDIASGRNYTQLQLDLRASLTSAFLLGDHEIYARLTDLSIDVAKTSSLEISKAIDDLISLNARAWGTFHGNSKANMLYSLCRKYGENFSAKHIESMVSRGVTYSRVGIIALGILYDEYPQHVKSLNLHNTFEMHEDIRISYYCALRERYLNEKSLNLWCKKDLDYKIGNLDIPINQREELFLKWPNRGDSTILDFLVYAD